MNDKEFLTWIHQRLVHLHRENPNVDYMGKLRSIIKATSDKQLTPNTAPDIESILEDK